MKNKMRQFDSGCRRCPRLASLLDGVRAQYPDYHAAPVAPFGAADPALLIVGLAPGMHGANATGRPFTGDYAGVMLYETLYKYGFSTAPESRSIDDGLELINCRITNAVKCLPPQNKPETAEIKECNSFLAEELKTLKCGSVVLALGTIAHNAVLRAYGLKPAAYRFGHREEHELPAGLRMIDSYHCSRYNTQTKRLTETMFHDVFVRASEMISQAKDGR